MKSQKVGTFRIPRCRKSVQKSLSNIIVLRLENCVYSLQYMSWLKLPYCFHHCRLVTPTHQYRSSSLQKNLNCAGAWSLGSLSCLSEQCFWLSVHEAPLPSAPFLWLCPRSQRMQLKVLDKFILWSSIGKSISCSSTKPDLTFGSHFPFFSGLQSELIHLRFHVF